MSRFWCVSFWTKAAALAALMTLPAMAAEVYVWTDEDGVRHFSSMPPTEDTGAEMFDLPEMPSMGTEDLGDMQAQDPEPENGVAEDDRLNGAGRRQSPRLDDNKRAQVCDLSAERLRQMEASPNIYSIGQDGEMVLMEEEERNRQLDDLRSFIEKNCE